uniref:Uncharacterized protein n=1 Tax=Triticum urartu TaxID=4572 RepID=A0A8R7K1R1_TRIUA
MFNHIPCLVWLMRNKMLRSMEMTLYVQSSDKLLKLAPCSSSHISHSI